jgi:D-alanyl-D-alanine dipeptidase
MLTPQSCRDWIANPRGMRSLKWFALTLLTAMELAGPAAAQTLPGGFVFLRDIDPSIIQDIRYAGANNFVGRRLAGYEAAECVVKREVGLALQRAQQELAPQKLSLKMLDCYRPAGAVHDMVMWARNGRETPAERRYNPAFSKKDLFRLGYIAERSGHSTGAAVDLTLVDLKADNSGAFDPDRAMPTARRRRTPALRKAASTWAPAMIVPTSRRTLPRAPSRRSSAAGGMRWLP